MGLQRVGHGWATELSQGSVFLSLSPRVQWIKSFFSQAAGNALFLTCSEDQRVFGLQTTPVPVWFFPLSGVFSQACTDHSFAEYSRRDSVQVLTVLCLGSSHLWLSVCLMNSSWFSLFWVLCSRVMDSVASFTFPCATAWTLFNQGSISWKL